MIVLRKIIICFQIYSWNYFILLSHQWYMDFFNFKTKSWLRYYFLFHIPHTLFWLLLGFFQFGEKRDLIWVTLTGWKWWSIRTFLFYLTFTCLFYLSFLTGTLKLRNFMSKELQFMNLILITLPFFFKPVFLQPKLNQKHQRHLTQFPTCSVWYLLISLNVI